MKKICYLLILAVMILPSCSDDAAKKPAGGSEPVKSRTPEPPPEMDEESENEAAEAKAAEEKAAADKAAADKAAEEKAAAEKAAAEKAAADKAAEDQAAAKQAAEAEASKMAEAKSEAAEAFQAELADLNNQFNEDMQKWQVTARAARTAAARTAAMKANPSNEYGQKYVDLYEKNSDVEGAFEALTQALSRGNGEAKNKAMELLAEMVAAAPDADQTREISIALGRYGTGDIRDAAIGRLLGYAKADVQSEQAMDMLSMLATMATGETRDTAFRVAG